MNNRYKEFWDQAAKLESDSSWAGQIRFMEKYTELIVRECGDVAYGAFWANPEAVRGQHIKEKIKQHFGVES